MDDSSIVLFVIGMLLCTTVCIGLACWYIVHKKKFASQQRYETNDMRATFHEDDEDPRAAQAVRALPQLYQPPKVIPNVVPSPIFFTFAQMPAPPPGNSLLFVHKSQTGSSY